MRDIVANSGSGVFDVRLRDGTCRVTNHREAIQEAHLIPRIERKWLKKNSMER